MTATKNDMQVLAPDCIDIVIGDRLFMQKPLSLRGTTNLLSVLAVEMQRAAGNSAVAGLFNTDAAQISVVDALPAIAQVLASIPDALPRIVTIMLVGKMDADTAEFIDENCRFPQAVEVLKNFIQQNEPEELIENFMLLRSVFTEAVAKAKAKLPSSTV